MARTGRRSGDAGTRAAILAAARDAFAARGYAGVTIRQIASAAAVDPALVHHYFTTKDQLFLTALHTVDPERLLSELLVGELDTLGERMIARFLALWEAGAGANATTLLRTAVTDDLFAQLVREVIFPAVSAQLVARVGVDPVQAPLRTALITSQLSGLVTTRYVLALEPMASAPVEWVVAVVGPTIQRYLTGELPGPNTRPGEGGCDLTTRPGPGRDRGRAPGS